MDKQPLVSIICLCYNHAPYIREAVLSTINQSYQNIETIIVDDCSTDNSADIITGLAIEYPRLKVLLLSTNHGNTTAFNKGLALSSGEFVIDLATDDVLLPNRVIEGVEAFKSATADTGVNFTNAAIIDKNSKFLKHFYAVDSEGLAIEKPNEGDIYEELIQKFFICPPTMMFKRSLLDTLSGYDETLAYEDFDFWIRSSRIAKYSYTDKVLVNRRKLKGSHSHNQYKWRSTQMESTFRVCEKIKKLNQTKSEDKALKKRIYYELRQCLRVLDFKLAIKYILLLKSI